MISGGRTNDRVLAPVVDVVTRWHSIARMLRNYFAMHKAMEEVWQSVEGEFAEIARVSGKEAERLPELLSANEMVLLTDVLAVMEAVEVVGRQLEASLEVTASRAPRLLRSLFRVLEAAGSGLVGPVDSLEYLTANQRLVESQSKFADVPDVQVKPLGELRIEARILAKLLATSLKARLGHLWTTITAEDVRNLDEKDERLMRAIDDGGSKIDQKAHCKKMGALVFQMAALVDYRECNLQFLPPEEREEAAAVLLQMMKKEAKFLHGEEGGVDGVSFKPVHDKLLSLLHEQRNRRQCPLELHRTAIFGSNGGAEPILLTLSKAVFEKVIKALLAVPASSAAAERMFSCETRSVRRSRCLGSCSAGIRTCHQGLRSRPSEPSCSNQF